MKLSEFYKQKSETLQSEIIEIIFSLMKQNNANVIQLKESIIYADGVDIVGIDLENKTLILVDEFTDDFKTEIKHANFSHLLYILKLIEEKRYIVDCEIGEE